MPPFACFWVARIPVLDSGIFDLGIVQGDQFHHSCMQLVVVIGRRCAAFEIADIRALFRDDQRPLKLARFFVVDAEIGRKLHGAAHSFRNIDERTIGKDSGIQGGKIVVADRHDGSQDIF